MENAVASEIEVDHQTNLLQFAEDEICEHYANLATHKLQHFSMSLKVKNVSKDLRKF